MGTGMSRASPRDSPRASRGGFRLGRWPDEALFAELFLGGIFTMGFGNSYFKKLIKKNSLLIKKISLKWDFPC